MHKAMKQTLQKIVGSSSLYSCSQNIPAPNPIPKPNPSLSLPHSSSSSALFNRLSNRVYRNSVEVQGTYFYCDTEDFKEMLNDYKKDPKKMQPYLIATIVARCKKHSEDDEKLMQELEVFGKVDRDGEDVGEYGEDVGEYEDIYDMDPEERNQLFRDSDNIGGEWKEVISPMGGTILERVDRYPPNPYGVSGWNFSLLGRVACKPILYRR